MFTDKQLVKILDSTGAFPSADIQKYKSEADEKRLPLENYLISKRLISEDSLYENAATVYKVPFIKLGGKPIRKDILFLVPEPLAKHYQIIAYDTEGDSILKVVTTDPENLQAVEFLKKKTHQQIALSVTTPDEWQELMKQYHKSLQAEFSELSNKPEKKDAKASISKDLKELAEDLPVIRVVDTILEYAIFEGASDIHIEPEERDLNVRYRIDGVLKNVMTLPKPVQPGVIARIKVLSNLKLDEHRMPQDGRFKIETEEYKVAFRVSVLPTFDGEKIVLRLLNEGGQVLTLAQLGMQPKALELLQSNIQKPHGMILVTGPTGSGKTTTLYTVLNVLNKPEVNISTVEDPVEYRMERINQSQVNPKIGYTFAMGLRALLRQDPNIIMVGEIRDLETAEIAVNAAMTGHLLLSTLHTNDAVTAIPRLFDMGIPPFLVASTTNMVMAQRLVRRICTQCISSYTLDQAALDELRKQFNLDLILEALVRHGSVAKGTKTFNDLLFYRGKGCKQCNNEGYKGRIGVYEVLDINKEINDAILRKADREELQELARKQGMTTILEDGFLKAKAGITSIEEVLRVTQE
ncbi:MAG: ATPase, T2SS/T4P/T4SS family [Patescibacteria group bacterium]|jgi:type IV pilus assembly protein PilB